MFTGLLVLWLWTTDENYPFIIKIPSLSVRLYCVCVVGFNVIFDSCIIVSGWDRAFNAHLCRAAWLICHAPDTEHVSTSHVILTLSWPVLALPRKSEGTLQTRTKNQWLAETGHSMLTFVELPDWYVMPQTLVETGHSMLTFVELPGWYVMPQTRNMSQPVMLSWHWPVLALSRKSEGMSQLRPKTNAQQSELTASAHLARKIYQYQMKKKDNKQCLSDTPHWSMKKTNIKNTNAIQNG